MGCIELAVPQFWFPRNKLSQYFRGVCGGLWQWFGENVGFLPLRAGAGGNESGGAVRVGKEDRFSTWTTVDANCT